MRDGPPLIVEQNILYQLLAERGFWDRCPELSELRAEGEQTHAEVVRKVLHAQPGCLGCSTLQAVMSPFLNRFARHLAAKQQEDPQQLRSFIDYVSSRRGFRPRPIIVYHKDQQGRIAPLQL